MKSHSLIAAAILGGTIVVAPAEAQRPVRGGNPGVARPTIEPKAPAPKPSPVPTTQGNTAPRTRGTYRVSLTGFTVNRETYDDPLQLDGKRDEIYVAAEVLLVDRNNQQLVSGAGAVRSPVFGDVGGAFGGNQGHNGRVKAGSASVEGGLRGGDHYPTSQPWRRSGTPSADRFPLELWRGELVQGENGVLVTPTIWEFDSPDLREAYRYWQGWGQRTAQQLSGSATALNLITQPTMGVDAGMLIQLAELGFGVTRGLLDEIGKMGDRPIGMERGEGKTNEFVFKPKTLVLNFDAAERLLAQSVGGRGPGSVAIPYEEAEPKFGGSYTLYLLVERVP